MSVVPILFNGNGYSEDWAKEAERRGLLNLATSVDAYKCFAAEKNMALFERHGVMSRVEVESREAILFENYAKIVNIEALTMIERAARDIIPAVNAYVADVANTAAAKREVMGDDACCFVEKDIIEKLSALNACAYRTVEELRRVDKEAAAATDAVTMAELYCDKVIPVMERLREAVDAMEPLTAAEYWPLPSYGDMMFRV